MGGFGTIGVILFFAVLLLTAHILLRSHTIKVVLEDKELKRAATIIRLRNIATCLGLLAISSYFLLASGQEMLPRGSAAYATRESIAMYVLYTGLLLLAAAAYLLAMSRKPEFNFERSLHQYAVKEKIRAKLKFGQKTHTKRSTRV